MTRLAFLNAQGLPVDLQALARCLDSKEKRRLAEFAHPARRREYVIGKVFSRWMAKRATGWQGSINSVPFTYEASGKPRLSCGAGFTLSHADDIFAVAVGPGELGVDIEKVQPLTSDVERLIFHPSAEKDFFGPQRTEDERIARWTLKEAYLKYSGAGLSVDPRSVFPARLSAEGLSVWAENPRTGAGRYQCTLCFTGPQDGVRIEYFGSSFFYRFSS